MFPGHPPKAAGNGQRQSKTDAPPKTAAHDGVTISGTWPAPCRPSSQWNRHRQIERLPTDRHRRVNPTRDGSVERFHSPLDDEHSEGRRSR